MTTSPTPSAALQVPVEASIRVVEKATCFSVHRGNEVLANFTGPECAEHARLFADALLASAAGGPVGEPQGVTDAQVDKAIAQLDLPKTTVSDMLVRNALESFAASRPVAVGVSAVAAPQAAVNALRACNNEGCGWSGKTDRVCGSIGPLCPLCGETTEAVAFPATGEGAQS